MASNILQTAEAVITEVATIAATITIDDAELTAGALVKAGQIASVGGKPVYVYLSENPAAT